MFDDLFKTDTKSNTNTSNNPIKETGMFSDLFTEKPKQTTVTPQVTTEKPITPTVTEQTTTPKTSYLKPKKFLSKMTNVFMQTLPGIGQAYSGYSMLKNNKTVDTALQPIIDKTLNTQIGKDIVTTTEKATRGSSLLKATPSAFFNASVDMLSSAFSGTPVEKDIIEYYDQAVSDWEKGGQDPSITLPEKVARGVLDSGVQSGIGVLLNFIPYAGKPLSTAYYGALSASEQVNERGQVNSLGNIAIDVIGDRILGNTLEGLFKKPAKDLIKVGLMETAKNAGKGFLVEGITEPAQTFLKYVNDYRMAKTPEQRQSIIDQTKEYVKNGGMLLEFLVGGISGAGISTVASIASQAQINPNIPKPKIGITEDDDKEYTPEQNKIREAFREDIKQNLSETGMNKPYVARQISKETGIDNAITTLMVDEVAETITATESPEIDNETIIQQALNEAGSTLEETKTEEAPTTEAKMKISKEEPLITEAKKYKSADEFVNKIINRNESKGYEELKNISEIINLNNFGYNGKILVTQNTHSEAVNKWIKKIKKGERPLVIYGNGKIIGENGIMVIDGHNRLEAYKKLGITDIPSLDISQLEEIYKQAHEGEAKMKIKKATNEEKIQMSKFLENLDTLPIKVDGKLEFGDSDLYFRLDQLKNKDNSKEELTEEEWLETKELLEEAGLGLDTLITKEDNKTYGDTKISKGITREEQPNGSRDVGGDVDSRVSYKLEERSEDGGISRTSRKQDEGRDTSSLRDLPRNAKESEVRGIITDLLPEAKPQAIDKIVSYYFRLDDAGFSLRIQRQDNYKGYTNFDAFIQPINGGYSLTLNNKDVAKLTPGTIDHELGTHAYYPLISNNARKSLFNGVKKSYQSEKELFDGFTDYHRREYWRIFIKDFLPSYVKNANNRQISDFDIQKAIRDNGFIDENNEVIYPEDIMETIFNFAPLEQKFNKYLVDNKFQPTTQLEEQTNIMAEEIVAFIADNSTLFKNSTIKEVKEYAESIANNTLEFTKPERNLTFGGVTFKLKDSTKLTSADIIKKHANIQLKRDIVITDVYGEKATLKAGEGITPYEVTGNKFILQDGETYLVSKSQAQNVINNSKTGEAKPFAPELKQTEETIRSDEDKVISDKMSDLDYKINLDEETTPAQRKKYEKEYDILSEKYKSIQDNPSTKYSQYTLPGGENYKEILIKAPDTRKAVGIEKIESVFDLQDYYAKKLFNEDKFYKLSQYQKQQVFDNSEYSKLHDKLKENKVINTRVDITDDGIKSQEGAFKSSHWDEPNVISHIRMNERTYNGKKVAFMEELQSDWAREARKTPEKLPVGTTEEMQAEFGSTKTPTHPLLKNWQELSIKRALQEAVNSNAKYFAWINGPQTAARYNLSKEIENMKWTTSATKLGTLNIKPKEAGNPLQINYEKDGKIVSADQGDWIGKNIADVIGKGVAEKILESDKGLLEGEGLNMGGEWATNLYDRQVKTIVENLTGQKVEMLDMGLTETKPFKQNWLFEDREGAIPVTRDNIKIGDRISNYTRNEFIVTDVLEDGKFKAMPRETLANYLDGQTPKEYLDIKAYEKRLMAKNNLKADDVWVKQMVTARKKFLENSSAEFDLFDKTPKKSIQMGIELTPEVKAIVKSEAPQVKVSGKLPFTEQITAPVMFKIKLPDVNTGNKAEDAKQILAHVEKKLGVTSIVNSIKEKETAVEIAKEVLNESPASQLEKYVADAGAYKGTLPEVTGKSIAELKKNPDYRGIKNEKALEFAKNGDSIAKEIFADYGIEIDSEEARQEFEDYKDKKEVIKKQEKDLKVQKDLFKTTDTFKLAGIDKTLIGEITQTREMPGALMEIMDQVKKEKKARREEVLNHPARPLMKYVDKKTQKLPKIGSKTAFGKEGEQILKDLKFDDVQEANKSLADYISKRNEFVNPVSRLALQERAAKFLRDKQKILEEVEKKIKAEARDRKSKLESIRDFFYMTEGEMRDAIGDKDYRLLSETEFEKLLKEVEAKSIEIALHTVAVAEVEWTIAEKELHRVENMQEVLGYNKDLNKLTTEELDNLNAILGKYQRGDVFLGVREMETLAKNANLPDVKTQRQILEEVLGKRTGLSIEKLREIVVGSFDDLRSAVSLARQNAFYEVLVSDFYQLKIEAGLRYREIEQKTNELVRLARQSRPRGWKQRFAPTDDMVIAYLEEGDLETKALIAKDMTPQELELAHYVKNQYAEMRDFLIARQQLEKERQNYYTHRPRGFFEAWLRDGQTKTPTQFIRAFGRAFKETFIDVNKMDEATFKILNEQTEEILPLEKFFKYSMRRSGQLIPTKNLANAFLGYTKTFELKKGLDQYMPRMEAVARALTPTETTEGGVVKDTSLEKFVKKWINTQKGRPVTVGPIQPGGVLDGLIRSGIAFTRFLDLALRIPAQVMSIVGEESATWINIGTKKYLIGEYRAKTKQGAKIAKKYEAFVGTKFWDKMREESQGIASKLGETLFAFYGIAARQSNIHHLLGVLTKQEFESGNISPERLVEIKMEMNRWRADDLLHSVMGKTSVGAMFREHKSWAIPIVNQVLSNIKTLSKMVGSGEYQTAAKSKEFGELFRGTMLTLILVLTLSRIYKDLKEKKDRNLAEELEYRAMNDAQSFLAALSPKTLGGVPRLAGWLTDLATAVTSFAGALATGERTAKGDIPGAKGISAAITPKLIKPLFTPTEEDKVNESISTSTIKAQKELDLINKDIVNKAKTTWEEVKNVGVGTEEADALVNEISDEEYEAYKLVKKADDEYWSNISEKVTPIVHQAFKLEFGTEEANKLVENLSDDEYEMYKKVKSAFYGKGEATAMPSDWDKQSFITHVKNMAKGWTTDPVDAFNKLIKGGDWKITGVTNGQIIVNRLPVDASEKIKQEAAKNNANWKLDHIWSVAAGGGSDKNNLNIISKEEWEENTPVEVYLINQLKAGNISGKKAKEYMVRFKIGRGQITEGKLFEEYKTPITFEEIKQEIAK